ncbi:MAG TPA: hypothetical protein VGM78_03450 [Ilumatobacteraceae bacterium]
MPPLQTWEVRATSFAASGDAGTICSAAITHSDPNHYSWQGLVLKDQTVPAAKGTVRWLFCYGEAASGQGVDALWSTDSHLWRSSRLDFGLVSHAGEGSDALVVDDRSASVTYDSWIRESHVHAFTRDGGQTWTVWSAEDD